MEKTLAEGKKNQGSMGATVHKSSGSAVPNDIPNEATFQGDETREWLVILLTHQKYTKTCCKFLAEHATTQDCEVYVPCRNEKHVYPNRTTRVVTKYVIPNIVFVTGLTEAKAYHFVPECPYINIFLPDRARAKTDGRVALAKIHEREIRQLRTAIKNVERLDDIEMVADQLTFSDEIEVVGGQLTGMAGNYYTREGKDFLVFSVGKLGNVMVRVDKKLCKLKKLP